jgi:hypothetical protein
VRHESGQRISPRLSVPEEIVLMRARSTDGPLATPYPYKPGSAPGKASAVEEAEQKHPLDAGSQHPVANGEPLALAAPAQEGVRQPRLRFAKVQRAVGNALHAAGEGLQNLGWRIQGLVQPRQAAVSRQLHAQERAQSAQRLQPLPPSGQRSVSSGSGAGSQANIHTLAQDPVQMPDGAVSPVFTAFAKGDAGSVESVYDDIGELARQYHERRPTPFLLPPAAEVGEVVAEYGRAATISSRGDMPENALAAASAVLPQRVTSASGSEPA